MSKTKTLVTVAIGDGFRQGWERDYLPSWRAYAERHGYGIVVIDTHIDSSPRGLARPPHWQKLLVMEDARVAGYDQVVWLDCDVLISPEAPCIVSRHDSDKLGIISYRDANESSAASHDNRLLRFFRFSQWWQGRVPTTPEIYVKAGLPADVDDWTNTGVMVMTPRRHAGLFRHVYDDYDGSPFSYQENIPLSYEIFKSGDYKILDKRFNCDLMYELLEHYPFTLLPEAHSGRDQRLLALCINTVVSNNWFVHFVSGAGPMRGSHALVLPDGDFLDRCRVLLSSSPPALGP